MARRHTNESRKLPKCMQKSATLLPFPFLPNHLTNSCYKTPNQNPNPGLLPLWNFIFMKPTAAYRRREQQLKPTKPELHTQNPKQQQQHQQSINLCSLQPADQSPRKKKNQRKALIIYQLYYCTSVLLLLQNANANLQWLFNLLGASSSWFISIRFFHFFLFSLA